MWAPTMAVEQTETEERNRNGGVFIVWMGKMDDSSTLSLSRAALTKAVWAETEPRVLGFWLVVD